HGAVDDLPGIVLVPVAGEDSALRLHTVEQSRTRIRGQDMKGTRGQRIFHRPVHRPPKYVRFVGVEPEDKTAVDHDAERMKPLDGLFVVLTDVLALIALDKTRPAERFEAHEDASETGFRGFFNQVAFQDRVDGGSALEDPVHALHSLEEARGKPLMPEQMIVQEIEMSSRKPVDLRQRRIHLLGIEDSAAFEKRILIAKVAMMRTAARHDDRVGNQVPGPFDEVPPDGRYGRDIALAIAVDLLRIPQPVVPEECGERIFPRSDKDAVRMRHGLFRQRADMQAAETDMSASFTIVVRQRIGPEGVRDIHLDDDEVRTVIEAKLLHVLVLQVDLVVWRAVSGQRGQAQQREQQDGALESNSRIQPVPAISQVDENGQHQADQDDLCLVEGEEVKGRL